MNEQCWFIRGFRLGTRAFGSLQYHSEGNPGWVKFDWSKAAGKVIGFYHSHPSGFTGPSGRDDRTMKAWVISEGKPMVCGIFCDGKYRTFLYFPSLAKKICCSEIKAAVYSRLIFRADWASMSDMREV